MDATVKAGLLDLIGQAAEGGWPIRRACALLGLDDMRAARWAQRRGAGQLEDRPPGGNPLHGLLAWEREAIIGLFEDWHEIDRSHRKLAHRGSRLGLVHVSGSTVRRVLAEEGLVIEGPPPREPAPRSPWPDWLTWKPDSIWAYDFTHWTRARRASIAILDVVSRKWLATLTSAEESSTQVEACFLAGVAIAQQFGRPHTPQDQAWIETLFGHVKGEWPHLEKIRDPGELDIELDRVRAEYNSVRLHAAIGYVAPDDEHEGRGEAIRQARRDGLAQARLDRIAYRRNTTPEENQ